VARAAPERVPAAPPPPRIVVPPVLDAPVPSVPAPLRPPEPAPPLSLPDPPALPPPRAVSPPAVARQYPDLSAYVAERRRLRGEPAEGYGPRLSAEDARRERALAENLAAINAPQGQSKHTGGLFQITRVGHNEAEFTFFGWHHEIKRRASQRIEVRRGSEPDIRIAIVRRMIAIIRQYEQEDFTWRSNRLGRDVTLSARQVDTAGLEDFLLREFF
jgi:hypothetical protein